MIRWLAGESVAFHQLTGHKITLCAGESSDLAQNELSPPKLQFHQNSMCVGNMAIAEMTQTVKVVIDGNRLVMEHAQEMLEHRS
jgi:hypothetical protein